MRRTRIKICGVRDARTISAAADAGADAVGFVFVGRSPRYIAPEQAWPLVAAMPPFLTSVGLFQDAHVEAFSDIEQRCPTALSQLHGDESERVVRECGPGVIKSVRFDPDTIERQLRRWAAIDEVDAILVDGSAGGEGVAFDWTALAPAAANLGKPVILAGGLTPDNVAEAIASLRPYAVDVSSGVERERGVKDTGLIHAFCDAVRAADATA